MVVVVAGVVVVVVLDVVVAGVVVVVVVESVPGGVVVVVVPGAVVVVEVVDPVPAGVVVVVAAVSGGVVVVVEPSGAEVVVVAPTIEVVVVASSGGAESPAGVGAAWNAPARIGSHRGATGRRRDLVLARGGGLVLGRPLRARFADADNGALGVAGDDLPRDESEAGGQCSRHCNGSNQSRSGDARFAHWPSVDWLAAIILRWPRLFGSRRDVVPSEHDQGI